MRIIYLTLVFCFLILTSGSCKKESDVTPNDLSNCHFKTNWDSTSIYNQLVGRWKWEYIRFVAIPENSNSTQFKDVELEFKNNGSVFIWNEGSLTRNGNWEIRHLDGTFFELVTSEAIGFSGRILFCNDEVEFKTSHADGSDNYFKRK